MYRYVNIIVLILLFSFSISASGQSFDKFQYKENTVSSSQPVVTKFQFNGYTNHWQNTYRKWYRTGNLFKISADNVESDILQSKIDIAQDMGIPGLIMQEGFFWNLHSTPYKTLTQPEKSKLIKSLENGNVLVFVNPDTELGGELTATINDRNIPIEKLKSNQRSSPNLKKINAFFLQNKNGKKLFVVSCSEMATINKLQKLLENTNKVLQKYKLYKGWFGVETRMKSVSITPGHPLDLIGAGMNEGNSWFVFGGYMDYLLNDELNKWKEQVKLPIVTDVGFSPIYGCNNYNGFQDRLLTSKELWVNFAHKNGGYVFRNVFDPAANAFQYDGYFATEGNKEQIDNENVPFVLKTGLMEDKLLNSMVLFLAKNEKLTRESMWKAILERREVGVLEKGLMMGPAKFRNALQFLLLDRVWLEDYFGDRINLESVTTDYDLQVSIKNTYLHAVTGEVNLSFPPGLKVKEGATLKVNLPAGTEKTVHFSLQPTPVAMNHANAISIQFNWDNRTKNTVALFDLPPVISVHQLLYGHTPKVNYPVTIHNFSLGSSFPVKVQVVKAKDIVYEETQICDAKQGTFKDMLFELKVPTGNYNVKVTALGVEFTSQLGVGEAKGFSRATTVDLNNDGVNEYCMENDSVQVTLLSTGARVIEYIVKSRNDNLLFKLWPKKVIDDKRPFRERAFYPYGGFEDFLGQGSMENHRVYNARIERKDGDYVRVRMWTDYFGNRLEKTFTLYGNSPLLEIRFALTFKNPEANLLGPQPMLSLGKREWTEDVFTIPELDGLHEYRMRPEKRYGMIFYLKEGWNAGYDTKEDISFVGAYPVDQPIFLHMFLNEPGNHDTHYFYGEFQPWVPIIQKSTMYFSYYMWGTGGSWEKGKEALKRRNLITTTKIRYTK